MFRTSGQSLFKFEISLHMRKHFMCCQLPISIPFKKKSINSSFLGKKPPWGVLMKSVLCFLPSKQRQICHVQLSHDILTILKIN